MNKLLLSSLVAVALSSTASAFILDISSLIGQQSGIIDHPCGDFQVETTGDIVAFTDIVTSTNTGRAVIDTGETLKITYPSNVTYVGAFVGGNATATASTPNVIFLSAKEASTVDTITFQKNAVPEPSSTAFLGLGGIALILRRRK